MRIQRIGRLALGLVPLLFLIGAAAYVLDHYQPFDYLPRETWGPYLQDVRPDAITIAWKSKSGKRGFVAWGRDPRRPAFRKERRRELHAVRLRGLEPGNTYWYRVNDGGAWLGEWRRFRTAPAPGAPAPFVFGVLGDSGDGSPGSVTSQRSITVLPFDGRLPDTMRSCPAVSRASEILEAAVGQYVRSNGSA